MVTAEGTLEADVVIEGEKIAAVLARGTGRSATSPPPPPRPIAGAIYVIDATGRT